MVDKERSAIKSKLINQFLHFSYGLKN